MARDINELDSFPKVDGGWRIRSTERFYVDVLLMGYNYRIVTRRLDQPGFYERGWCYPRLHGLAAVVLRAYAFDPDAGEEPTGWIKEAGTERRACAFYFPRGKARHTAYDPDCGECGIDPRLPDQRRPGPSED
jgi:hypothetical protein